MTDAHPLEVAGLTVRRSNLLVSYMATLSSEKVPRPGCGKMSREAQVYQILRKAQGSAVPVFLGTIDLAKIYFLHGAGEIRHMLVMGWGGESTTSMELTPILLQEIHKSNREIKALGIIHEDLRRDNILWNEELGRALIIDFHRSTLKSRPTL